MSSKFRQVRCPICHSIRPFYLYKSHVDQCRSTSPRTMLQPDAGWEMVAPRDRPTA